MVNCQFAVKGNYFEGFLIFYRNKTFEFSVIMGEMFYKTHLFFPLLTFESYLEGIEFHE
jgi:hypothetical protein